MGISVRRRRFSRRAWHNICDFIRLRWAVLVPLGKFSVSHARLVHAHKQLDLKENYVSRGTNQRVCYRRASSNFLGLFSESTSSNNLRTRNAPHRTAQMEIKHWVCNTSVAWPWMPIVVLDTGILIEHMEKSDRLSFSSSLPEIMSPDMKEDSAGCYSHRRHDIPSTEL